MTTGLSQPLRGRNVDQPVSPAVDTAGQPAPDKSPQRRRPVVVTMLNSSFGSVLIQGQLGYLKSQGYRPILIAPAGPAVEQMAAKESVEFIPVEIEREIRLVADLLALGRLIRVFHRLKPDIVNAGTPKAGLLGTLAGWFCRVPVRIYTLRGFRHESAGTALRLLLMSLERVICRLAHRVICISPSLMSLGLSDRIIPPGKPLLIGAGSSNGIDLERFSPGRFDAAAREALRRELGLGEADLVVGFVGRLNPRKGVAELVRAWGALRRRHSGAKLLLVGPPEEVDQLPGDVQEALESDASILKTGFVDDVERYFAIMDLFVLPTYAEGFGNVLIQAAAMALPIVTTDVTGVRNAVKGGHNATLVPARDTDALGRAIETYMCDKALRRRHGTQGRAWVETNFDRKMIWQGLSDLYARLLKLRRQSGGGTARAIGGGHG